MIRSRRTQVHDGVRDRVRLTTPESPTLALTLALALALILALTLALTLSLTRAHGVAPLAA